MKSRDAKLRRLERLKQQCSGTGHSYPSVPFVPVNKQKEDDIFVPTRPLMYERIKNETLKTDAVKKNVSNLPRKEKRKLIRAITRSAVDSLRCEMIEEMQQIKGE